MAITLVDTQHDGVQGINDTNIPAPAMNVATGDGLIVGVKCEGTTTINSVTDTAGNTYTAATADATYTTDGHCRLFYCANATANAANVVQGNFSNSIAYRGITVWQVRGHDPGAGFVVDSDVQTGSGTATMTSPSITAGDAAFFFIGDYAGTTATPGSGWTEDADDSAAAYKAYHRIDSPGGTYAASGTLAVSTNYGLGIISIAAAGPSTATLSAPTPSGTLGTDTTATIGATTDQTSGTFYAVVDSAANLAGVTATQIKAGQKASGSAALAADSNTVSGASVTADITGLSAATLYAYAAVQNNANGDSNVVTGTFATGYPVSTAWLRA